jgi:thiamine-phosphate pyrophosphorylase
MGWAAARVIAITDRARMCGDAARADVGAAEVAAAVARRARTGLAVQVRERDLDGGPLLALVRAVIATGVPTLVNDRLDVALAAGAAGVHLPEDGLAVTEARALVAHVRGAAAARAFVIGASRHSLAGVREAAAAGADAVQLGPIWETPAKGPALGLAALSAARAALEELSGRAGFPRTRLVAVGGIDSPARAAEAWAAGADAVAAIRGIWSGSLVPDSDPVGGGDAGSR